MKIYLKSLTYVCFSFVLACSSLERSEKSGYGPLQSQLKEAEYPDGLERDKATVVRKLESRLESRREKEQYSRILPLFENEEEKIEFLSMSDFEQRQQWINEKKIWSRRKTEPSNFKTLIEQGDIALGMKKEHVRKSWGDPQGVETSGNPIYQNERWRYLRQVSSSDGYRQEKRFVYFEGGRVVGWETE